MGHDIRMGALLAAEQRAMALLDAIEAAGLIAPGRTERMVEQDIYALAEKSFGVRQHWHKRIVRSGVNTLCIAAEDPPVLEIAQDDTVFLDLGPVFDEWEADVGRTYALGSDPLKHRLCADLEPIFEAIKRYFDDHAGAGFPWRSNGMACASRRTDPLRAVRHRASADAGDKPIVLSPGDTVPPDVKHWQVAAVVRHRGRFEEPPGHAVSGLNPSAKPFMQ